MANNDVNGGNGQYSDSSLFGFPVSTSSSGLEGSADSSAGRESTVEPGQLDGLNYLGVSVADVTDTGVGSSGGSASPRTPQHGQNVTHTAHGSYLDNAYTQLSSPVGNSPEPTAFGDPDTGLYGNAPGTNGATDTGVSGGAIGHDHQHHD